MRKSGILLALSSLPSEYGIGDFGEGARGFIDFLNKSGQYYWQILPLNPTAYGDSPYQSPSAFAGNPYFIDVKQLYENGLLTRAEEREAVIYSNRVDYARLWRTRTGLLKKAAARMRESVDYSAFVNENRRWLLSYGLFTVLRQEKGIDLKSCMRMAEDEKLAAFKSFKTEIETYCKIQHLFFSQWFNLKKYANTMGVHIIGDVPIYVAEDSADVWTDPQLFRLDKTGSPAALSGCPPDSFSPDGQLWGNPMYDWQRHKQDEYRWWLDRLGQAGRLFDMVRIDHFRGFYSGYAVPQGATTARDGEWIPGPGMDFVRHVRERLPSLKVIAEDLGFVTDEVRKFFDMSGFPGMKIMQFSFDEGAQPPYSFPEKSVAYTGTHDNPTVVEWMCAGGNRSVARAMDYLGVERFTSLPDAMIRAAMESSSFLSVIPLTDWLKKGGEGRMNTPATLGGNWTYRIKPAELSPALAQKIRNMTELFGRL